MGTILKCRTKSNQSICFSFLHIEWKCHRTFWGKYKNLHTNLYSPLSKGVNEYKLSCSGEWILVFTSEGPGYLLEYLHNRIV